MSFTMQHRGGAGGSGGNNGTGSGTGGSVQRKTIEVSAGEEVRLASTGTISIELLSGVMEIAGMALEARKPYTFYLRPIEMPSVVCYTLEGGSMEVKSERALEVRRGPTGVAELHRFARRHFSPTEALRVVVIGRPGVGKTHAAATLCNLLQRVQRRERGTQRRTFLVDLNPANNVLFAPGCVSSREVTEKVPLWLGHGANPACGLPTLSFFCGTTARPSSAEESFSTAHFSEQCVESTAGWVEGELLLGAERGGVGGSSGSGAMMGAAGLYGLVVDTPSPQGGGLLAVTFYKQLLQALQPTHVVLVTDELPSGSGNLLDDDDDDDDEVDENEEAAEQKALGGRMTTFAEKSATCFTPRWAKILVEDLTRAMPGLSFIRVHPVTKLLSQVSSRGTGLDLATHQRADDPYLFTMRLLQRYFIGGALYPVLACSKVVISTSAVQFVELRYNPEVRGITAYPTEPPHLGWSRLVCSLSHAEMLEEVPLAPTAGLLIITHVDEQADELAVLIPASSADPLPRRFIVLPSFVSAPSLLSTEEGNDNNDDNNNNMAVPQRDEGLRITPSVLALVEESSVV